MSVVILYVPVVISVVISVGLIIVGASAVTVDTVTKQEFTGRSCERSAPGRTRVDGVPGYLKWPNSRGERSAAAIGEDDRRSGKDKVFWCC